MRAMGGSPMVFVSRRPDGQLRIPENALTDYQDHLEDSYDQAVRESNRRAAGRRTGNRCLTKGTSRQLTACQ